MREKPPKKVSNKTEQINVRWEPEDIEAIRAIAEREDRSASSIVRFLVRWGIAHYNRVGSIHALGLTSVVGSINKMTDALRKASKELHPSPSDHEVFPDELHKAARLKLDFRKEDAVGDVVEVARKRRERRRIAS